MYAIRVEEITDPDYKVQSTDVIFKSSWEAEVFVYDMNVKRSEREGDRILFKVIAAALIFMGTLTICALYSGIEDLYKLRVNYQVNHQK